MCFLGKTLPCFILYSKAKLVCYSRYLLTSDFCIPVHYDENGIFFGVSSRRSWRSSWNHSVSALALVVGVQTYITVMLNGLPWKQAKIILSFLRLHPNVVFRTLVDCEGYRIPSKGFLPTVVDIMII